MWHRVSSRTFFIQYFGCPSDSQTTFATFWLGFDVRWCLFVLSADVRWLICGLPKPTFRRLISDARICVAVNVHWMWKPVSMYARLCWCSAPWCVGRKGSLRQDQSHAYHTVAQHAGAVQMTVVGHSVSYSVQAVVSEAHCHTCLADVQPCCCGADPRFVAQFRTTTLMQPMGQKYAQKHSNCLSDQIFANSAVGVNARRYRSTDLQFINLIRCGAVRPDRHTEQPSTTVIIDRLACCRLQGIVRCTQPPPALRHFPGVTCTVAPTITIDVP